MEKNTRSIIKKRLGITLSFAVAALALIGAAPASAQPPTIGFAGSTIVGPTTAQITGNVNPNGKTTSCRVEFGTTNAYGTSVDCNNMLSGTTNVLGQVVLQSLKTSTLYHWRFVASNEDGTTVTKDSTFTTKAPGPPTVSTEFAKATGPNTAEAHGTVSANGTVVTSCVVEFGLSAQYGSTAPCDQTVALTGSVPVTATLSGLSANTEYHYRFSVRSTSGTADGADMTFRTLAPPTILQVKTTFIGATTAQITGQLNPNGQTTSCSVEYGVNALYGNRVDCGRTFSGTSLVLAQFTLQSLKANQVYHWRLVASNDDGTTATENMAFFAGPPAAPLVTTQSATSIGSTSAVANGTVLPNGSTVSSCVIEFGLTTQYGSTAPCDQTFEDTGRVPVTATLNGLLPDSEYHYRVTAQNEIGIKNGADLTFKTPAALIAG